VKTVTEPKSSTEAVEVEPEWARESYITQRFGLGHTSLYNLRKKRKIRSSSTLVEGEKRAVRLFHVGSVRQFIEDSEEGALA